MRKGFIDAETKDNWFIGMASEELAFYLAELKNGWKSYDILPYNDVLKYTEKGAGNYHNYTHMYLDSKFQPRYVKAIRMKTLHEFSNAIKYIERYEKEVMKNTEILKDIL